jgi:MFS superfamily sulfate permease-like transporter
MSQDQASSAGLDRRFRREWIRPDLLAGLTTAAVVVPKSLAYATIAGLPVQIGLYTAFVPMVIYALLGSSRVLSVSTTTTIAILTGSALGLAAPGGEAGELALAAATLAVMVGLILVAASVLRLGFVANFISEPVLTGFKSAIGVVIVVDQIPKLLGIHIHKEGFFRDLLAIVQHVPEASVVTVVLSVALLALIFGMDRLLPKAPAPLLAVALAILASAVLGLPEAGVATVGEVPQGLPELTRPVLGLVEQMWPAALGIALMSFTETIAAGRAFADPSEPRVAGHRPGQRRRRAVRCNARWRRHLADCGQPWRRREVADGRTGDGRRRAGNASAAGAGHRADAEGGARRGRHCDVDWPDQAGGFRRDPPRPNH